MFGLMVDSDYYVEIYIDEVDGIYRWGYADENAYYMFGNLYASTFNTNTTLTYTTKNVPAYLLSSTRELASSMIGLLCSYMNNDLKPVGLTAQDLGFYNF